MEIIITENYDAMSEVAAGIISKTIIGKPDCVLGLATGTTKNTIIYLPRTRPTCNCSA